MTVKFFILIIFFVHPHDAAFAQTDDSDVFHVVKSEKLGSVDIFECAAFGLKFCAFFKDNGLIRHPVKLQSDPRSRLFVDDKARHFGIDRRLQDFGTVSGVKAPP